MKKKLLCLSFVTLFSLTACGEKINRMPDYSGHNDEMLFYAYASANDGTYDIDNVKYSIGENLLTREQFQMYRESGLNVFHPGSVLKISATESERQASWNYVRPYIDEIVAAGIDKVILYDEGLSWFGLRDNRGLIGTDEDQYPDEDALDERVNEFVKLYADYPGIYAVVMADEPKASWVKSYGELYNSILRVNKKYNHHLEIQYNLNPLIMSDNVFENYYPYVEGTDEYNYENVFTRYRKYIDIFMEAMNPSYIQYDSYPMRSSTISDVYLPCLQYVAGVAKERGIDFNNVTQTFAMRNNGVDTYRKVQQKDAEWMNNILLGFGVDSISYFTYFTHDGSKSTGEFFIDDTAMVNNYGQKTYLYDIMKEIIGTDQKFAPTYKRFDYVCSDVVKKLPLQFPAPHLTHFEKDGEFTALKEYTTDKECAFISELYDEENDFYMYDVMNIVDPSKKGSTTFETISLTFDTQYKYALVYKNAEPSYYRLKNNKLDVKVSPGEAWYVIPFN